MKLYEISENLKELESLLENIDDLTESEQNELINEILSKESNFKVKTDNTLAFIKTLEVYVDGYKKEITRLQKLKKTATNLKSSLRQYVSDNLDSLGISNLRTDRFNVHTTNTSKVIIDCEIEDLPDDCIVYDMTPNLTKIKELLAKENDTCRFAHIESKKSITIK